MWGTHLKQKGRWWHYYRSVPREFADVERKPLISFSLKTGDFTEAKRMAADISARLEQDWRDAKARGVSLCAQDAAERYRAAAAVQRQFGFAPKAAADLTDEELLERLRLLISGQHSAPERGAVLGLNAEPQFSLSDAFDRFWDYIKDEWPEHIRPLDPGEPPVEVLGDELVALFDRAFSLNPADRPNYDEWRRALTQALHNCWIHGCGEAFVADPHTKACPGCGEAITLPQTSKQLKIQILPNGPKFGVEVKDQVPIVLGRSTMTGLPPTVSGRHLEILPFKDKLLLRHVGTKA